MNRINVGPEKQKQLVGSNPELIKKINLPCEGAKLVAVQKDGMLLEHCLPTTERVIIAALRQNGLAVQFIKRPSRKTKAVAVTQNGGALQYMKGVSYAMKKIAVKNNGLSIQYIRRPSEELWMMAIEENGEAIKFHPCPTEKMKREAVFSLNPDVLTFIDNPDWVLKKIAVKSNGLAIKHLPRDEQTTELQKLAVQANPNSIQYMEEADGQVQLEAVKKVPATYFMIKNPLPPAIQEAKRRGVIQ